MKKLSILTTLLVSMLLVSCGGTKTQEEAIAHNDAIVADEQMVSQHEYELVDMIIARVPAEEVKKGLETYKQEVASLIEKYTKMEPFDKKDIMRLAVLDYLNDIQDIITKDLTPFVNLYNHDFDSLTDEELDLLDFYAESINEKMENAINKAMTQQKIFAKDYNIEII